MSDILFPPLVRSSADHNSIGYVVGGGLKENLRVRLTVPAQEVQEGSFVIIDSADWRFYGLVTDLQLGTTDPRFADEQSETRLPGGLAAHIQLANRCHVEHGNCNWSSSAVQELITLLRDDYPTLMTVLGALSDITA